MRLHMHLRVALLVSAVILGGSSRAFAQERHIAGPGLIQQTVQTKASTDQADRDVVARVLQSTDAQLAAAKLGLDLTRAQAAVATLDGSDLAQVAGPARLLDANLSGGSNVIVISTTTLLLLLILLVLILK